MGEMQLNRRAALLGMGGVLAGGLVGRSGWAAANKSPLAHGILADNALAQSFEKVGREMPDVSLVGPQGECNVRDLVGRTILMPIWAEWCAPCLSELPDFARLQQKYGNDKFAVIPVLSGTYKKMTIAALNEVFGVLHAKALPPYMEKREGRKLVDRFAQGGIPCNLVIAPDGMVVARETGRVSAEDASEGPVPTKTKDAETVTRAIHGQAQSLWGKREGEAFAAAMAAGFLTKSG